MEIKNGQNIEFKTKDGKIGNGVFREGRNYCYILSEKNTPIKIKDISAIRIREEETEIDPKLQQAVEADLATYDMEKLKSLGDKSADMVVKMGKLFLMNNADYAKDADKNGKAYTKIVADKLGLNKDGSEKSDEQKQAEEEVKEVKKEGEQSAEETSTDGTENGETQTVQESRKNKFINRQYSRYYEDEGDADSDGGENLEESEMYDYSDDEELDVDDIDIDAEQEVLDNIDDSEDDPEYYDETAQSLEDEENFDYDMDYENGYAEEEVDIDDVNENTEELENDYEDSEDTITLEDGQTIELRDLFDKIKIDVEDKIEEILDEIESSDEEFSDEKIIDELSDEFDIDGKEVLAEMGNVPDTVLRISEIARQRIMKQYLKD